MMKSIQKNCVLILVLYFVKKTNAEVFTSVDHLEKIFPIEKILIDYWKDKISEFDSKLNDLKNKLLILISKNTKSGENVTNYFDNPINSFLFLKRLTIDWQRLKSTIQIELISDDDILLNRKNKLQFPTTEDLRGAADAIARLQDMYDISADSLADGIINGNQYGSIMTSDDCYVLAMQLNLMDQHALAIDWLKESLKRISNKSSIKENLVILDRLASAYTTMENYIEALNVTEKILAYNSTNEIAIENKIYLEKRLHETNTDHTYDFDDYKKLCQNQLHPLPAVQASLRCRHLVNNVPFLLIGPLKLEEASLDPYIVTFHDVLYDSEIEYIKQMTSSKMNRCMVSEDDDSERNTYITGTVSDSRICKFTWLFDGTHDHIQNINRRIVDMTKLSLTNAEPLQIANYGIGGHYDPHFDFSDTYEEPMKNGNRIATVLFYMNDVQEGGATVFMKVNVSLWPRKGSASFWYNLRDTGEQDHRTMHAGCPVLIGNKWVSNKWIHENYQELHRPCSIR